MTEAVLLMMHQGNSFTQEVSEILKKKGLALLALSSRPPKPETFEKQQEFLADWIVVDRPQLELDDAVGAVATFAERGHALSAAIATFEGYRLLMAELNRILQARDSSGAALRRCLDKHQLRQFLFECELSAVRCIRLHPDRVPDLDPAVTWFVKPVRGAASFASFMLEDIDDLRDLARLQDQMKSDHKMSAIFMNQFDFLVEEYIEGPEFSFETIVVGEAHHICVHEKAKMEIRERTTLEAMSISPPVSVDRDVLLAGAAFVSKCLARLGLDAGAFHVEAKYWTAKKRWEIIEINPRMGGSLINDSVKAVTGAAILELWLETLLAKDDAGAETLRQRLRCASQLETMGNGSVPKATVFLSKYGEKGRTIKSIEFSPPPRKPQILKLHVEPGTALENSDRAICLMDALWQVDYSRMKSEVEALDKLADQYFSVEYQ